MAADPNTGYDPDDDMDLKNANARFAAAGDQHTADEATASFNKAAPAQTDQPSGLQHWFTDLPQNIGSGLMSAAINTADAAHSGWKWVNQGQKDAQAKIALATGTKGPDQQQREDEAEGVQTPEYDTVRNAVQNFKSQYIDVQNPTMSDNITQGVAQFAIPFLGWSKAVSAVGGAGKLAAAGRTMLAESATAGTAMAPTDGRFADMVELGKHTEGKFADALNAISPDGSLVNNYLNYMTADRENEGEFEARAKNIVDTITGGAIISPLIHAGMGMLKGGMAGLKYSLENGVGSVDQLGVSNQAGKIGYHGTPHDFDTAAGFDNSKIGSGEGAQVYGYGHYLAESPDVARGYQARLSQLSFQKDDPMGLAQRLLDPTYGNLTKQQAVVELNRRADSATDPNFKMKAQKAAQLIKSGATDLGQGSLIAADVADRHVDAMLDWDKPLSEQTLPQAVQDKITDLKGDGSTSIGHTLSDPDATGADLQMVLQHVMGPTGAAKFLDANGVPGIKYLDGNSRGAGEGTKNLVVFDGKKIDVRMKNGQPVRGTPQDMSQSAEARALERERVAAQRQREDGIIPEHEPEIIPPRAARAEGEAARRDAHH